MYHTHTHTLDIFHSLLLHPSLEHLLLGDLHDADVCDGSIPVLSLGGGGSSTGGIGDNNMIPLSKKTVDGVETSAIQSLFNHNVQIQHSGEESEACWNAFFHES